MRNLAQLTARKIIFFIFFYLNASATSTSTSSDLQSNDEQSSDDQSNNENLLKSYSNVNRPTASDRPKKKRGRPPKNTPALVYENEPKTTQPTRKQPKRGNFIKINTLKWS